MRAALTAAAAILIWPAASAAGQDSQWTRLGGDRDAEEFYAPATVTRQGGRVQVEVRAVLKSDRPMSFTARLEFECAAQTRALLWGREFGEGPEPIRTRIVPADQIEREPLFEGSEHAGLYRTLCPDAAPLPKMEGPPLIVTTPGG